MDVNSNDGPAREQRSATWSTVKTYRMDTPKDLTTDHTDATDVADLPAPSPR